MVLLWYATQEGGGEGLHAQQEMAQQLEKLESLLDRGLAT
jgi:hypothetical protein